MTVNKNLNGSELTVAIEGRLDTMTAPSLEAEIKDLSGVTSLIIDMAKLEYISSAGLRVLLATQKRMNAQGKMEVHNVAAPVMEVFEITGFSDVLTIK